MDYILQKDTSKNMKNLKFKIKKSKAAFSMVELVFAIVILGILAAMAIPRLDRDYRQEATTSIVSSLMYAKHMAITDNVTNPTDNKWQRAFWRFGITKCSDNSIFYYIASDTNHDGIINPNETINDTATGKIMMADPTKSCIDNVDNKVSPSILLTKKYGIDDSMITFTNCTPVDNAKADSDKYIGFDYFGRIHKGFLTSTTPDFSSRVHTDCQITLSFKNDLNDVIITIESNTGFISVNYQ